MGNRYLKATPSMGSGSITAIYGELHEIIEAFDLRRLLPLPKQLAKQELLITDERGFVVLSNTGTELLFEVISQRYERGLIIVTSNLPIGE